LNLSEVLKSDVGTGGKVPSGSLSCGRAQATPEQDFWKWFQGAREWGERASKGKRTGVGGKRSWGSMQTEDEDIDPSGQDQADR
jgi:hypothetical protein